MANNLLTNSSFENAISPAEWEDNGTAVLSIGSDGGFHGSKYAVITANGSGNGDIQSKNSQYAACSEGDVVSASCYYRWITGTPKNTRINIQWFDSVGGLISTTLGTNAAPTGSWTRNLNENKVAPALTSYVGIRVVSTAMVLNDVWHVDAIKVEKAAAATAYDLPPAELPAVAVSLSKADTFYQANGGGVGKSIQDLMYAKYLAQKSALPTLRQTSADFQRAAKGRLSGSIAKSMVA